MHLKFVLCLLVQVLLLYSSTIHVRASPACTTTPDSVVSTFTRNAQGQWVMSMAVNLTLTRGDVACFNLGEGSVIAGFSSRIQLNKVQQVKIGVPTWTTTYPMVSKFNALGDLTGALDCDCYCPLEVNPNCTSTYNKCSPSSYYCLNIFQNEDDYDLGLCGQTTGSSSTCCAYSISSAREFLVSTPSYAARSDMMELAMYINSFSDNAIGSPEQSMTGTLFGHWFGVTGMVAPLTHPIEQVLCGVNTTGNGLNVSSWNAEGQNDTAKGGWLNKNTGASLYSNNIAHVDVPITITGCQPGVDAFTRGIYFDPSTIAALTPIATTLASLGNINIDSACSTLWFNRSISTPGVRVSAIVQYTNVAVNILWGSAGNMLCSVNQFGVACTLVSPVVNGLTELVVRWRGLIWHKSIIDITASTIIRAPSFVIPATTTPQFYEVCIASLPPAFTPFSLCVNGTFTNYTAPPIPPVKNDTDSQSEVDWEKFDWLNPTSWADTPTVGIIAAAGVYAVPIILLIVVVCCCRKKEDGCKCCSKCKMGGVGKANKDDVGMKQMDFI